MARQESMAAIDAVLNGVSNVGNTTIGKSEDTASIIAPHAAPGVEAPTPIADSTEEDKIKSLTPEEQAAKDSKERLEHFNDIGNKVSSIQGTANTIGSIVKSGGATLERIPTPGSIVFPLVVLLIFFFLLIPVNGHTRLVWVWLVITGNASIGSDPGMDTSVSNPTDGLASSLSDIATSNAIINTSAMSIGTFMTGVQDLS